MQYLKQLLGDREDILLETHQHWFVLVRELFVEIISAIIIIVIVTMVVFVTALQPLAWLGYILLLIPLISAVRDIVEYRYHQYVVTNRRVIQVMGVFNKNVIDSSLEKVNDVKMEQSVLGRLFDYGDIEILTASELGINRFTKIGNPIRFKTAMLNAKQKLESPDLKDDKLILDIPSAIAQLDVLRKQGVLTDDEFLQKKTELLSKL